MQIVTQPITLDTFNLASNERRLCAEALRAAGNLVGAAKLLGITRHSMKRRIIKLGLDWTRRPGQLPAAEPVAMAPAVAAAKPVEKVASKPADKPASAPKPAEKVSPATKPVDKPVAKAATEAMPAADASGQWVVQLGAYKEAANVKLLLSKLKGVNVPAYVEKYDSPQGTRTRVRAGPFATQEAAEKARARIKIIGVDGPVAPR